MIRTTLLAFSLLGKAGEIVERQDRKSAAIFPYKEDSIGAAFRRACVRLQIADLLFHDLRHEGASRLFEQGYQIPEVALKTGHRDWHSLKRYTNLKPIDLHRKKPDEPEDLAGLAESC